MIARRAGAVLAPAMLIGLVVWGIQMAAPGGPGRPTQRFEFLPPFRMVWVEEDAQGEIYTIELMWRGSRSWITVLRASSADPRSIGRIGAWNGVTLTSDDPVQGRETYTPELTVSASLAPAQWLLDSQYSPDDGWEPLGLDPDGNERFRKTETRGAKQRTIVRTRDPATWLVVASTTTVDGEHLNAVRVIDLEILPRPATYP